MSQAVECPAPLALLTDSAKRLSGSEIAQRIGEVIERVIEGKKESPKKKRAGAFDDVVDRIMRPDPNLQNLREQMERHIQEEQYIQQQQQVQREQRRLMEQIQRAQTTTAPHTFAPGQAVPMTGWAGVTTTGGIS